jgi:hypothetical protein
MGMLKEATVCGLMTAALAGEAAFSKPHVPPSCLKVLSAMHLLTTMNGPPLRGWGSCMLSVGNVPASLAGSPAMAFADGTQAAIVDAIVSGEQRGVLLRAAEEGQKACPPPQKKYILSMPSSHPFHDLLVPRHG